MRLLKAMGLEFDPFDRGIESEEDVFLSEDFRRTQEAIREAIHARQMLVICGPRGAGKTVALREVMERAAREIFFVRDIALDIEKLRINHLREALVRRLLQAQGMPETLRSSEIAQTEQLRRVMGMHPQQVVLVLEDGHRMQGQSLINLKRLRELSFGRKERLLTIIILAQPSIARLLDKYEEVKLRSHVSDMEGLSSKEVTAYIAFKVKAAGGEIDRIFEKEAVKLIARNLRWPLDVNAQCSLFLHDAAEAGYEKVTEVLVQERLKVRSDLFMVYLASGTSEYDIQRALRGIGKPRGLDDIHNLIRGIGPKDDEGTAAIRQILVPYVGEGIYLMNERVGQFHQRLRGISQAAEQNHLDLGHMARDNGMSLPELVAFLQGQGCSEAKMVKLEKWVRKAA